MSADTILDARTSLTPDTLAERLLSAGLGFSDAGRWREVRNLRHEAFSLGIEAASADDGVYSDEFAFTAIDADCVLTFHRPKGGADGYDEAMIGVTAWLIANVPGDYALIGEGGGPSDVLLVARDGDVTVMTDDGQWSADAPLDRLPEGWREAPKDWRERS